MLKISQHGLVFLLLSLSLSGCCRCGGLSVDESVVKNSWILTSIYVYDGKISRLSISAYNVYKAYDVDGLRGLYDDSSIYGKIYLLAMMVERDSGAIIKGRADFSEYLEESVMFHNSGTERPVIIKEVLEMIESGSFFDRCINLEGFYIDDEDVISVHPDFL